MGSIAVGFSVPRRRVSSRYVSPSFFLPSSLFHPFVPELQRKKEQRKLTGPRQIAEITPYAQSDLHPAKIYVLDAFFEMYILVGADASPEYASFRNALDFAQEYAILASGIEDRPFIPVSTVVLEGVPRDMKSVFRKWREGKGPTRVAAGLRRGSSLRVVPLTQALQALAE